MWSTNDFKGHLKRMFAPHDTPPSLEEVADLFEWMDSDYKGYLEAADIARAAVFKEALRNGADCSMETINLIKPSSPSEAQVQIIADLLERY